MSHDPQKKVSLEEFIMAKLQESPFCHQDLAEEEDRARMSRLLAVAVRESLAKISL